ncbi:MAG: hypothetical protein COB53_07450 [Elusimicrobia bacterium]|nr:MAG: hypothetical protein COB53_07450 [Elusimicrobiota bacterium]
MLLPLGAIAAPDAKESEESAMAVRVGDFVYLKMPRSLGNAVRSPGWSEDAPKWVASLGEFKISPMRSLIRSPGNILTAVDADGQTREVEASKDEVELLRDLGAKSAGKYGYALKRFLRLEIEDSGKKSFVIEAGDEQHRFAFEPAS